MIPQSVIVPRRLAKNGWTPRRLWVAAAAVLLSIAAGFPAWASVVHQVRDYHGRHLLLVPLVSAWLFWVRRKRIMLCRPGRGFVGAGVALLGLLCYAAALTMPGGPIWFGDVEPLESLAHAGAVLLFVGTLAAALGHDATIKYSPAIAILLVLTPPPEPLFQQLALPLQIATGELIEFVYSPLLETYTGYDEGMMTINDVPVPMEGVSQGLPMALALFLVAYGYVFGQPLRGSVRAVILLLSPIAAILCSAVAVAATFWVFGLDDITFANADRIHMAAEVLMLLVAFLILSAVMRLLIRTALPVRRYTLAYEF
jgi:hypothetical protein